MADPSRGAVRALRRRSKIPVENRAGRGLCKKLCRGWRRGGKLGGGRAWPRPSSIVFFHDDVQFADFFSEGVAVDAENLRGTNLIAAGLSERQLDQRALDALDHEGIEVVDVDALGALKVIFELV